MNLKEKLIELSEYKIGFNIYDGNFVINISYPSKWTVFDISDDEIQFVKDNGRPNLYYYICPITVNVDRIFEAIDETIKHNTEMEEKVKLFHVKVDELKELFTNEPFEVVKTLEFKVKKKKTKKNVETVALNDNDENNLTEENDNVL